MSEPRTFDTITIRVPSSGVVRRPGPYPHQFASMPLYWCEVNVGKGPRYVVFPVLPPGAAERLQEALG